MSFVDNTCDDQRAMAKFSKSRVWDRVPEASALLWKMTEFRFTSAHCRICWRKPPCQKWADPFGRFDRTLTCDKHRHQHTTTANTALAFCHAGKNAVTACLVNRPKCGQHSSSMFELCWPYLWSTVNVLRLNRRAVHTLRIAYYASIGHDMEHLKSATVESLVTTLYQSVQEI